MSYIHLNGNSISGTIPTEFFSMTKLGTVTTTDDSNYYEAIRLDYNTITGTIPSEIGNLQSFYNYNDDYFGYGTDSHHVCYKKPSDTDADADADADADGDHP